MVKLISLLKKLPGRTHEEFAAYWTGPHADLDKKMPRLKKYVINVLNTEQMTALGGTAIFDGVGELYWDSVEDMQADFASAEGLAAGEDGGNLCEVCLNLYVNEHIMVDK